MPHLLLTGPMDLFEIVKILLDCPPIGYRRQDLFHARCRVGAEEGDPTIVLAHQHDTDQTPTTAYVARNVLKVLVTGLS